MTSSSIPVGQVFDMLGISVETNDAWRVAKVRENGTADKSGVKVGDVITAFDDQDVNAKSDSVNFGSISKITVRRDGKLIPLKLIPR
jgi:Trypsin-like serine proteases, typically periplasmic, contain C-terminal PDZ domain